MVNSIPPLSLAAQIGMKTKVNMRNSERNRFQNGFTVCNIALDSVVSDMFGKSASEITDYLLTDESPNAEHCATMLHRSLKRKAVAVVESIEGFQLTEEQKFRMLQVRHHMEYLQLAIEIIDIKLEALTEPYAAAIKLLRISQKVKNNRFLWLIKCGLFDVLPIANSFHANHSLLFNTASGMPCANPVPWKSWYQWTENVVCGAEAVFWMFGNEETIKTNVNPYLHWCGADLPTCNCSVLPAKTFFHHE